MAGGDLLLRTLQSLSWIQLALLSGASFLVFRTARLVYNFWHNSRSPLRKLPGPHDDATWLLGHTRMLFEGDRMDCQEQWVAQYGDSFAIRTALGKYQLITTDQRAMTHIMFATHIFQKPESQTRGIKKLLGGGLVYVQGEEHRDQRRIMNPAFGHAQVRELTPLFLDTSAKLCEIWNNKCIEVGGTIQLNALDWLSKATLDAIGKAGFDYDFNALNEHGLQNELAEAYGAIFRVDTKPADQRRDNIRSLFPSISALFPTERSRQVDDSRKKAEQIGNQIVQDKRRIILAEQAGRGHIEKKAVVGKDLISLLLKANLAQDLDPSQRLSDHDILTQIPTFLFAGHETTSNSTTWALYALALYPEMQKKLRDELLQVGTDSPSLEMLNSLHYLDKVSREVFRCYPVISFLIREVAEDDVIPLGRPIVDADGNSISQIRVQKGDEVQIPIWLANRSKSIWGPDADQFRPDRWDNVPGEASTMSGIQPNLMTFIGGPRACIGHRFAVAEMKALLFHIMRRFEFRLAVGPSELWARTGFLIRPQLRKDNTVQLPLVLSPVA